MTRPGDYQAQHNVLGAPAQPQVIEDPTRAVEPASGVPAVMRTGQETATGRVQSQSAAAMQALAATQARPAMPAKAAVDIEAPAPAPAREGTVYTGRNVLEEQLVAPSGRQYSLRIGWHKASLSALSTMGVASPGTGLILGADHDQQPVPIRFFRPEPTRITLVGGVWAAQLLAFRALALGAQVVVMTIEPQSWQGFGERAVGRGDRVIVLHGEQPGSAVGTARQPALVIHDLGVAGATSPPPIGPWQTHFTTLRRLDDRGVPAVQRCDLLMLQRLHPTEAAIAESALRLTGQSAQLLQMMEDEMLALIGGGANRYLWLHPTTIERQFMGNAWR